MNAPYQSFRTKDSWINIGAANQRNWLRLLDVLDAAELKEDPRFATNKDRMSNLEALVPVLEAHLQERATDEWLAIMEEVGLPAGPVMDICQLHQNPQALAREMIVETEHPQIGSVKTIGLPVKFSETPGGVRRSAPMLGQDGREILREHGYSPEKI